MLDKKYIDLLVDYVYSKQKEGEETFRTIVNSDLDNYITYSSITPNIENERKDKHEISETPLDNPSNPSIKLIALMIATKIKADSR